MRPPAPVFGNVTRRATGGESDKRIADEAWLADSERLIGEHRGDLDKELELLRAAVSESLNGLVEAEQQQASLGDIGGYVGCLRRGENVRKCVVVSSVVVGETKSAGEDIVERRPVGYATRRHIDNDRGSFRVGHEAQDTSDSPAPALINVT